MSYTVSITRNDIPRDDKQAWKFMKELYNNDNGQPSKDFVDLIKKLTEQYPCICDLPHDKVDDGVWSDGPLIDNAGDKITTLGVVYSQVENVIPFVIETSNNLGFVVFDGQTGLISRPDKNTTPNNKPDQKGFWSRLFRK
jgi:hypothetical protein